MVCPCELTYVGINNIHCKTGNVQIPKLLLEELLTWDKTIKNAQITYESKSHFPKEVRSRTVKRCRCLTNINNLNVNVAAPDYVLDLQPFCPIRAVHSYFHQWYSLGSYISIGSPKNEHLKLILTSWTVKSLSYISLLPLVIGMRTTTSLQDPYGASLPTKPTWFLTS